jgi:hypothetical protein
MSQKELLPKAERYLEQANSMRALADRANSSDAREELLHLAELYERLAGLVEELALRTLSAAALIATRDLPKK